MRILVALRAKGKVSDEKAKSKRLAEIRTSIEKMQSKINRDLASSDPDRVLTALAVAILNETGLDPVQAKKRQFRLSDTTATYRASKTSRGTIANPTVIGALRDAYETIDDDEDDLFRHAMGQVSVESMNKYMGKFSLDVEKLNGYNSNHVLQASLNDVRAKAGALPKGAAKKKLLKAEFDTTLASIAGKMGLSPQTLKTKYLTPGLESSYLKSGSFVKEPVTASAVVVWMRSLL